MSTPARKDPTDGHVSAFMAERPRLVGIAYRMLGDVSEAEDITQEAYLRFAEVSLEEVDRPAAYLTTVTTRLAIDRLRAAQRRRESYVGEWIAEPVLDDPRSAPAPDESVLVAESVTLGFLRMLDSLGPTERAVFLLHEVFDCFYAEEHVLEHRWRKGDIIIWDNIALQHARGNLDHVGKRLLQRAIVGEHGVAPHVQTD